MIDIIRGSSEKLASSEGLVKYFEKKTEIEGVLYLGYSIIGTVEGMVEIDALLISKQHGIIIFNVVEETECTDRTDIQK